MNIEGFDSSSDPFPSWNTDENMVFTYLKDITGNIIGVENKGKIVAEKK